LSFEVSFHKMTKVTAGPSVGIDDRPGKIGESLDGITATGTNQAEGFEANYHEAVQQFATGVTERESKTLIILALRSGLTFWRYVLALRSVFAFLSSLRRETGSWISRTVLVTDCGAFIHFRY